VKRQRETDKGYKRGGEMEGKQRQRGDTLEKSLWERDRGDHEQEQEHQAEHEHEK
jgi:hypothetical protein